MKDHTIIENYRKDEKIMILLFAQWCINHDLNPEEIYKRAYPNQTSNNALKEAITLTVSKEESAEITDQTLFELLSLYGNEELAFAITASITGKK